jgi:hypothetical protein
VNGIPARLAPGFCFAPRRRVQNCDRPVKPEIGSASLPNPAANIPPVFNVFRGCAASAYVWLYLSPAHVARCFQRTTNTKGTENNHGVLDNAEYRSENGVEARICLLTVGDDRSVSHHAGFDRVCAD